MNLLGASRELSGILRNAPKPYFPPICEITTYKESETEIRPLHA
jgi:hypothetical protein